MTLDAARIANSNKQPALTPRLAVFSPAVNSSVSNTLSDEQIRASLLTAVEDKMRRRLKEIFAQAQVGEPLSS